MLLLGGSRGEVVCLVVERGDEAVDALRSEDRAEFRPAGRELADRAVQINIGDLPGAAILSHQIIETDGLAVRFDDLRDDEGPAGRWLLARHLKPLSGIAVEPLGINRRDIAYERLRDLLALRIVQSFPLRADGEACHEWHVECAANHR